jgi:hypothetical protein
MPETNSRLSDSTGQAKSKGKTDEREDVFFHDAFPLLVLILPKPLGHSNRFNNLIIGSKVCNFVAATDCSKKFEKTFFWRG